MIRLEYEDDDEVIHIVEITEMDGLYEAQYWIDGDDIVGGSFLTTVYGSTPEEAFDILEEEVNTTAWRGGTPSFYEPFKYFRQQI